MVPRDARLQTWFALAFLAICLFNTVGLLLAKFLRRGGEIGVRRALGASKGAIFAQCLAEAAVIGLAGGIGGLLLTLIGSRLGRLPRLSAADLGTCSESLQDVAQEPLPVCILPAPALGDMERAVYVAIAAISTAAWCWPGGGVLARIADMARAL